MDSKILQEVEDEINRILHKYKSKDLENVEGVCDANNVVEILELLQQVSKFWIFVFIILSIGTYMYVGIRFFGRKLYF